MLKSFGYYDLLEAFAQPGCALCSRLTLESGRYLTSLLYEYSVDYDTHQLFRAARGLCNRHGWQLLSLREGLINVAVLYEAAVDEVLHVLANADSLSGRAGGLIGRVTGNGGSGLADRLNADRDCLCCSHLDRVATQLAESVVEGLAETRFVQAYQASEGFCLPHLVAVLRQTRDPAHRDLLVRQQQALWSRLKADISTYIMRYGQSGDNAGMDNAEALSWLRAIANLAGVDGVTGDNLNRFKA